LGQGSKIQGTNYQQHAQRSTLQAKHSFPLPAGSV
jgi:hypothetical protein